jgi:hypothetical protein
VLLQHSVSELRRCVWGTLSLERVR